MSRRERQIWNHYLKYLVEATQQPATFFIPTLSRMKRHVAEDCTREELRDMMTLLFEPGTVMQGLEQWQCMMDLLLFTGMDKFNGKSRLEHLLESGENSHFASDENSHFLSAEKCQSQIPSGLSYLNSP